MTINTFCRFCKNAIETLDRLFFACHFTTKVWKELLVNCEMDYILRLRKEYVSFLAMNWEGGKLKHKIGRLCLNATIYVSWGGKD